MNLFYENLKKHITLLAYLLPCPAARVPVTSSRRWGTVGHFGTAFNTSAVDSAMMESVRAKGGHFEFWQYATDMRDVFFFSFAIPGHVLWIST